MTGSPHSYRGDHKMPAAIYVWLVRSEEVLDQPGSWRIRKWDIEPFPEANFTLSPGPNNDEYTNWLEDELMECMRLVSNGLYGHGQDEDEITDALRLHGIRLLVEADAEKYEAALDRWQKRHPERDATSRPVSTTGDQGG